MIVFNKASGYYPRIRFRPLLEGHDNHVVGKSIFVIILIQKYQTRIMIKILIRINHPLTHQSREAGC